MTDKASTTQWAEVLAARDGSGSEAKRALESLCQTYWQPLYAYTRAQGSDQDEASDLTQAFFAELLEKNFLADVDPEKGRFRAFLLASLRHFLSHEEERAHALKRGGGAPTLSLDVESAEASYSVHAVDELTPADVFERRWALTALDRAMDRLRREAKDDGDTNVEQLSQYLTSADDQAPYREVAKQLGMTEGAVATAVHRLRHRYGECLRAEIAELVADPADVDDELRHMLTVVRG